MNVTLHYHVPEIWELKTVREWGKPVNNSFCAMGCADAVNGTVGQTSWIRGYQSDKDFILGLQQPDPNWTAIQKWQWAIADAGTVYLTDTRGVFRWPRICIGSKGSDYRNRVNVLEWQGDWLRIAGLSPKDYWRPLQNLLDAGLVHRTNCEPFQESTGYFSDTPHGVFYMALFDPAAYEYSKGNPELWITRDFLYRKVD